jgi:exopolyphosphatase/guanosine-5'-triphosphate,3'-diphosphate pyrophosphatase
MKIGIIDLGTNTFNLLVAEIGNNGSFETMLNTKSAVMLGQEGINEGTISDKAFTRAFSVLSDFRKTLNGFNCDIEVAFGTSAIRSAKNSEFFIRKIKDDLNILIEPISGDQEAEYIYQGIKQAVPLGNEKELLLDIGGGSNEFIIANQDEIYWKHSFPLGGARMIERFEPGDPIEESLIEDIKLFLDKELILLNDALEIFPCHSLIGSSGAFESFASIISYLHHKKPMPSGIKYQEIELNAFNELYQQLIKSSKKERLLMPGLEASRVDTIVLSAIFTKYIVAKFKINRLVYSSYALKEGVVLEHSKRAKAIN